jgi:hypothetical protein
MMVNIFSAYIMLQNLLLHEPNIPYQGYEKFGALKINPERSR